MRLRNHVFNPGAEGTTLSLEQDAVCTVARSNVAEGVMPRRGAYFYTLTATSTALMVARTVLAQRPAAAAGERWWVTARSRAKTSNAAARSVRIGVRFYNAIGGTIGTVLSTDYSSTVSLAAGASTDFSATGVAPAGTASVGLVVERLATGAVGDVLQFDDLQLTPWSDAVTPPGFFDGTSHPLSEYDGAIANSTSSLWTPVVTATPYSDAAPAPRIVVTIDDLPVKVKTLTVWRSSDRRQFRSRGALAAAVAGGFSFIDVEAPFNVASGYRAQLFDASGTELAYTDTASATIACDETWIHNPLDPSGARQVGIEELDGTRIGRPISGTVHEADTRSLGLLISGHRRGVRVDLILSTTDLATADAFDDMLGGYDDEDQTIPVLCVRTPRPYSRLPATFFAFSEDVGQVPRTVHMGGQLIEWDGGFQEVAPPSPGLVLPLLRRDDIDAAFATRNALDAAYLRRLDIDRDYAKAGLAG